MLFDRKPLDTLKESIQKKGVLVPITVYWDKAAKTWVILDGQRRWICAGELGLKTIPANEVAEPNPVQNIVTMFQIHQFREDWELMPTALKIEVLMNELEEHSDRKLSELTGLDRTTVGRCKKLLTFPKKYQDMMLRKDPDDRIKADFFIELYAVLSDRNVKKMPWFRRNRFTQRMLERYESKNLRAVTDFRKIKQSINLAVDAGKTREITKRLKEFADDEKLPLEYLALREATVTSTVRGMTRTAEKLEEALREVKTAEIYGEEELWKQLEALSKLIQKKLAEVQHRTE
jgi:ParB family chromosome partitioning protein